METTITWRELSFLVVESPRSRFLKREMEGILGAKMRQMRGKKGEMEGNEREERKRAKDPVGWGWVINIGFGWK